MKEKAIFVIKCIIVLLPVLVIMLYSQKHLMSFIDEEIPYYLWNKEQCSSRNKEDYDVLILGDSVANAAYMPEILSDRCINLSLGGTTPMENYYTLKDYLNNHKTPKSVYISFMDMHLKQSECFWLRTMCSHRYSMSENWEMLQAAKKFNDQSVYTDNALIDYISYELYMPNKYIVALLNGGLNQRYKINMESYNTIELHRGRYMRIGNKENASAVEFNRYQVRPLYDYYYKKLIQLCMDEGIKVHIVKLPLPDVDAFSDEYRQQVDEYYNGLKNQFKDITFDKYDTYECYCFADKYHMNTHGALKFSIDIKKKYPNEFDDNFSTRQINVINEGILNETYNGEVFRWLGACPVYELLVIDGAGDFETRLALEIEQNNLNIIDSNIKGKSSKIYYVRHDDGEGKLDDIPVTLNDVGYVISSGDNKEYNIREEDISGIKVFVIDGNTNTIICQKDY